MAGPCGHLLHPSCGCPAEGAGAPAIPEPVPPALSLLGPSLGIHPDVVARRAASARELGLLTQAEVDALPDGTVVELIWHGGNGPHRYEVRHLDGKAYALCTPDHPYAARETEDWQRGALADREIRSVGGGRAEDWVRLPTEAAWPHRTWTTEGRGTCPPCGGPCKQGRPPVTAPPVDESIVSKLLPSPAAPAPAPTKSARPTAAPAPGNRLTFPKKEKRPPGRPKSPWLADYEARRARGETVPEKLAEPRAEDVVLEMMKRPETLAELRRLVDAETCKIRFSEFCRQAWHVVEPSTKLVWNWHHELICCVLQGLFETWLEASQSDGKLTTPVRNSVINCPPGSLKSRLIAVFYPVWCWLRAPGMKLICLSVNEAAAQRDARASRDLIRSKWFQDSFKPTWSLKDDQDAISNFGNTAGGERLSKPSGSEIVGLRGDCVARGSVVATESGDVTVDELHAMSVAGEALPLVWSVSEEGVPELRRIINTRKLPHRPTVLVRTNDRELRCTADHRVWTPQGYTQAAHLSGRTVSVLRWADLPVAQPHASTLLGLPVRDVDVHQLFDAVSAPRGGVRQAEKPRSHGRSVLQQALQDDCVPAGGANDRLRDLSSSLPHEGQAKSHVLEKVSRRTAIAREASPSSEHLSSLSGDVPAVELASGVLHESLRGRSTLGQDDGVRQLELLGTRRARVRGHVVADAGSVDQGTRRPRVHRVQFNGSGAGTRGASRRPRPHEQRAGEPDNALSELPHQAPQVARATVVSVDHQVERGRDSEVEVYDLQVEGNHNFFANGVLVHNCLIGDDLNNPLESEIENEREHVNLLWDTNQYNRVNDPLRSLRITVQQRTNAGDHTGHVLERQGHWSPENPDGWLNVVLPAEAELARRFVMPEVLAAALRKRLRPQDLVLEDPRTEDGQSIDPVRMPKEYLAAERKRWEGTGNYAGQMQQRPALLEGSILKRNYWGYFRLAGGVREHVDDMETGRPRPAHCDKSEAIVIPPKYQSPGNWDFDWVYLSIDCAAKKTERGSNWGILVVAGKEGRRFVLDDRTQRGDILEIIEILRELIRLWEPTKILIEDKAAGDDLKRRLLAEMSKGDMPMITLEDVKVGTQGKEERLDSCLSTIANGMVLLRDGAPWLEEFVEEMGLFPHGRRNDRVDALTQILNHAPDFESDDWPDF